MPLVNSCLLELFIDNFFPGLSTDSEYPGIYEWNRITTTELTADANAEALTFDNWANGTPNGNGCVVMTAGDNDPKNGRWTDVDCSTTATYYGICEYDGAS